MQSSCSLSRTGRPCTQELQLPSSPPFSSVCLRMRPSEGKMRKETSTALQTLVHDRNTRQTARRKSPAPTLRTFPRTAHLCAGGCRNLPVQGKNLAEVDVAIAQTAHNKRQLFTIISRQLHHEMLRRHVRCWGAAAAAV